MIDSARNRLYVDDRINSRIQVFDLNGKFLDAWPNIPGPYCIRLTADGRYLWVADGYTQKIMKYEAMTGKLVPGSTWGTMGIAPGAIWGFHYFTTDSEGNLYVGEDMAFRISEVRAAEGWKPGTVDRAVDAVSAIRSAAARQSADRGRTAHSAIPLTLKPNR